MQIFVKMMTGRTMTTEAESSDTVADLKAEIHHKDHVSHPDHFRLVYGKTLADDNVVKESTLHPPPPTRWRHAEPVQPMTTACLCSLFSFDVGSCRVSGVELALFRSNLRRWEFLAASSFDRDYYRLIPLEFNLVLDCDD
ncbi:hypothetical protein OPV22_027226 [Ensete ventricosum]|uniref:Ubiquitin-like domain-containing protein n=1 Tax=Ensete ventricosum TaxID=4639 RepID=A0AAV8PZZ7_ENSVE|nr:hypothetical protein OPV22_027226 [Ensete ventricosum]